MSPSSKPTTSAGTVRARIYRFDPSVDASPRYDSFEVPFVDGMRVLDVLDHVYEELAENIGYRWYCGVQRCGSCAVRVNGREMLACWEPAERDMVIEPRFVGAWAFHEGRCAARIPPDSATRSS